MSRLTRFFKEHLLGIFLFAVLAGVCGNYLFILLHGDRSAARASGDGALVPPAGKSEAPPGRSQGSSSAGGSLALPARVQKLIDDYGAMYEQLEYRRTSVERFFVQAQQVRAALLASESDKGTVLERLTNPAFNKLEQKVALLGMVMNREESGIIFVDIDPLFFITTSRQFGTQADAEFFELYRETFPHDYIWPAWMQQQTDYSGCTKFEAHIMVDLYNGWTLYRSRFPADYTDKVGEIIGNLEGQFTGSTCACGDRESVIAELKSFLDRFSTSSIAGSVERRLTGLEDRHSPIRPHCISG